MKRPPETTTASQLDTAAAPRRALAARPSARNPLGDRRPAHFASQTRPRCSTFSPLLPCVIIGLLLTVARLALACATPMAPSMAETSDDLLLVQYAHSIASGNWLGTYGKMTLAKTRDTP